MDISCIYAIKNRINNKAYIGSTAFRVRRWNSHLRGLVANRHPNCHLQSAWNKYGPESFKFVILELVDDTNLLIEREQYWLNVYQKTSETYNFGTCAAVPARGYHHTTEARRKISIGNKGKYISDGTRRRISTAKKGQRYTEEARQNMSIAHKGKYHTKEQRLKISATNSRPYPAFVDPNGATHPAGIGLRAFCRKHGLHIGCMCGVVSRKFKQYKGWTLAYL